MSGLLGVRSSGKQFEQSEMWSGVAGAKHIISNISAQNIFGFIDKYCQDIWF